MAAAMPEAPPPGGLHSHPRASGEHIGPYRVDSPTRVDRLGEVYRAGAGSADLRLRLCRPGSARTLRDALPTLARLDAAGVAPLVDSLVDDAGRAALITPADVTTLAERRRAGRLSTPTVVALGAVLLDGLAALHAAGLAHGSVSANAVGIDERGKPRWQDAMIAGTLGPPPAWERRRRVDVRDCALMLRDLGRLPAVLDEVVDPVAAGVPGSADTAQQLALAWRSGAASAAVPVPPPGHSAELSELLPPRSRRRLLPRVTLSRHVWTAVGAACVAAAVALIPLVAVVLPGAGEPLLPIDRYLALRSGERLVYQLSGPARRRVTLTVRDVRPVAGQLTATLASDAGAGQLPLGLSGGTLSVDATRAAITTPGGAVRILTAPVQPGQTWSDRLTGAAGQLITVETRTLLGPATLSLVGVRPSTCVVVELTSQTSSAAGPGAAGRGDAWYCVGTGLARARLVSGGQEVDIDLINVR